MYNVYEFQYFTGITKITVAWNPDIWEGEEDDEHNRGIEQHQKEPQIRLREDAFHRQVSCTFFRFELSGR